MLRDSSNGIFICRLDFEQKFAKEKFRLIHDYSEISLTNLTEIHIVVFLAFEKVFLLFSFKKR